MNEREALIAAIAANPDAIDETPRLAFADWLRENGERDRADFIRLQCEANRLQRTRTPDHATGMRTFEQCRLIEKGAEELLTSRWRAWFQPFLHALGAEETSRSLLVQLLSRLSGKRRTSYGPDWFWPVFSGFEARGNGPVASFSISRGFVTSLGLNFESNFAVRDLTAAFHLEPVTHLLISFPGNEALWPSLDVPALRQIRSMAFTLGEPHVGRSASLFETVCASDNWAGLETLIVGGTAASKYCAPAGYTEQLASSPLLARVRDLRVTTDLAGIRLLMQSPATRSLRSLTLFEDPLGGSSGTGSGMGKALGEVLATAVCRDTLESLNFARWSLGDEGVREFVRGGWPKLRVISCGHISDVGVRYLLPLVPQLTELSLGGTISDAGAFALADAIDPAKLKSLSLNYNPLSPGAVQALSDRFGDRFQFVSVEEEEEALRRASGL